MNSASSVLSPDPEVIVFNLKERYTGVSATINALVPLQAQQWRLGFCGTRMSNGIDGMSLREAIKISRKPPEGRAFRIWHVRRDPEMMAAIFARDVLRLPIKLVFTSAAKHLHSAFPRWLISKMDAVISTTQEAASFVPNTTAVVPHGIDLSRFSPPADKRTAWKDSGLPGEYGIGVFGRIRPTKGTDVFVDAMIAALPQLPGATAVITGMALPKHKAYQDALIAKIAAAGLSDRIIFLGQLPTSDIHLWYQRCLLCVACPRYEPFGLTPFEAASAECALVCSRTGAFDLITVPGLTGEMVAGATGNLAQALPALGGAPWARIDFSDGTEYSGEAWSRGWAAKLGFHYKLSDELSVGGAWHSRTHLSDMKTSPGGASMSAMGGFADSGSLRVLDFQMPAQTALGVAWQATPSLMVAADVKRIAWKGVMDMLRMRYDSAGMGGSVSFGLPQQWKDQTVTAIGLAWSATPALTLRAGYNHASNPIPDLFVNPLFPATVEKHYTAGLSLKFGESSEVSAALSKSPAARVVSGSGVGISHAQLNGQLMISIGF
eukprot:gene28732-35645_t